MTSRPPDWQLPPGVTPGLWEYLHDPVLAQEYLGKISDSPFAQADLRFVEENLPTPCSVVDLGCGPGRSLLPLALRGFDCTGVDLSTYMLEQARQLLSESHCSASWIQANLGEQLPFEEQFFDAALCLFGTLGMLFPAAVRSHFLREVHRILKPEGRFLLHVHNRWPIQGLQTLNPWHQGEVTLPVHQGISHLQMKLYTKREIQQELTNAGFSIEKLEYLDAGHPSGVYSGTRWLAPIRSSGFLILALPG